MAFFNRNPFFNDPFFSDPFYTHPVSFNDYSLENRIINTLDNMFSNDFSGFTGIEASPSSSSSTAAPKDSQSNKQVAGKSEGQSKEVSLSDWINNYKVFHPRIDVSEGEKNYLIHADLPGMKKEDVKLEFSDGLLTISGERKNEVKETSKDHQCHRIERSFGKFKRSFTLPEDVDASNVQAKMDNGVLEINLTKKELPKKQVQQIQIQ